MRSHSEPWADVSPAVAAAVGRVRSHLLAPARFYCSSAWSARGSFDSSATPVLRPGWYSPRGGNPFSPGRSRRPGRCLVRAAPSVRSACDRQESPHTAIPPSPAAEGLAPPVHALSGEVPFVQRVLPTERRWNRTIQAEGCSALPVLKTGWATRPLPLRRRCYEPHSRRSDAAPRVQARLAFSVGVNVPQRSV